MFTMAPDKYNNDATDFLEDISSLNDDLKHPKINIEKAEEISIDSILDDPISDPIIQTETESLPIIKKQNNVPITTDDKTKEPENQTIPTSAENPEEIQNYVLEQCKDIIMQGKSTLEQLQDTVVNTCDGKAINGYATLLASLGKVMDTANAIANERSRIKSAVEMENLKHKHKTQIKSSEPQNITNNALIVAGREEIMKMLNKQMN